MNALFICIKVILRNSTYNFLVETSFCQFSNMASSGLKKMLILQFYIHKKVYQIHFFVYIKLQDKHFLQTWGSHVWKLVKACFDKEIMCSVPENNLNTRDQTEWETSICTLFVFLVTVKIPHSSDITFVRIKKYIFIFYFTCLLFRAANLRSLQTKCHS